MDDALYLLGVRPGLSGDVGGTDPSRRII